MKIILSTHALEEFILTSVFATKKSPQFPYVGKFCSLVGDTMPTAGINAFLANVAQLSNMQAGDLDGLVPVVEEKAITTGSTYGLFNMGLD